MVILDPKGTVINYPKGSRSSYTPTKGVWERVLAAGKGGDTQSTIAVSHGVAQKNILSVRRTHYSSDVGKVSFASFRKYFSIMFSIIYII